MKPDDSADILIRTIREVCGDAVIGGVEVGVSRGHTSRRLLEAFPALFLVMVDAWTTYPTDSIYARSGDGHARLSQDNQDRHKAEATANTEFTAARRHIFQSGSVMAAETFPDEVFDFAFIDDDHTAVDKSIRAWWPKVRPGGLLIGHDIDHPRDRRGLWNVRRSAVEHAEKYGLTLNVEGDVWWSVKPTS